MFVRVLSIACLYSNSFILFPAAVCLLLLIFGDIPPSMQQDGSSHDGKCVCIVYGKCFGKHCGKPQSFNKTLVSVK